MRLEGTLSALRDPMKRRLLQDLEHFVFRIHCKSSLYRVRASMPASSARLHYDTALTTVLWATETGKYDSIALVHPTIYHGQCAPKASSQEYAFAADTSTCFG